jgi:SAM-dependent methyltransferase
MTQAIAVAPLTARIAPPLFALTIFTSAALVFLVEPMIAKLILPKLGGSPAVWNTSMVFFQAALLAGYAYAHLIQRVKSLHVQVGVHLGLLLVAALVLPLRVTGLLGDPPTGLPIPWLLGVLTLSIGAPFAVLSATAPLLQAWYARVRAGKPDAENPYVLYAASNLGSFVSLLAYPAVVEPLLHLSTQRALWTGAYFVFIALIAALGLITWRARADNPAPSLAPTAEVPWREKLIWVLLAAAPSSLMLGVTLHLSVDIASAPFLWVIPLAIYLLTFVLAFQRKPLIPLRYTLFTQAIAAALCLAFAPFNSLNWVFMFILNIGAFFITALMCHQTLAARRPPPDRLTEFYLWLSVGGVVGGVFNALIAPMIFSLVREYPIVMVLAVLARPWNMSRMKEREWVWLGAALGSAIAVALLYAVLRNHSNMLDGVQDGWIMALYVAFALLGLAVMGAFMIRDRAPLFCLALAALWISAQGVAVQDTAGQFTWLHSERSFFGVLRTERFLNRNYKGDVMLMFNGTTLHGAQAKNPQWLCHPMLYYAPTTPIGQTLLMMQKRAPSQAIGVVGLGSGAIAAYKRPADSLTYFEIDPKVLHFAFDPKWFSYTTKCASGLAPVVMGDARLSLAKQPAGKFDVLIVDAFSSDSVPTHLLTEEALRSYLRVMKPGGVVLLHLSNRNLDITTSSEATIRAIGAPVLHQLYFESSAAALYWEASTDAVIFAKSPDALKDFAADHRWETPPPTTTKPWTDDYTNLIGALWRRITAKQPGD